ncbi:mycothiol system anti-sigma-R factor [Aeromicrobium sp.]|uniref:mycothiol system anti-sigma-R factor n=1 Tax=Aeromicrobium sp. TaxID=1871063 RepID=UPI003D6C1F45
MSCDNCETALEKLYVFLDEEIDTASHDEIQAHIDNCSSCLTAYDLERVVKALVSRSCAEKAPEPLRAKVLYSIRSVQVQITEQPG